MAMPGNTAVTFLVLFSAPTEAENAPERKQASGRGLRPPGEPPPPLRFEAGQTVSIRLSGTAAPITRTSRKASLDG